MPAWLVAILVKVGPVVAQALFTAAVNMAKKSGIINGVEASAIKTEHDVVSAMQTLKTYSSPCDFPDQNARGQAKFDTSN